MPNIKLDEGRTLPNIVHGTVEPIKVQAVTRHTAPINQTAPQVPASSNQAPANENKEPVKTQSPSPAEDPLLSSKFAALARKEKAIRQRYIEIQQKESEMSKLNEEIAQAKQFRERLKSNPLDVLEQEGVTYDQLVRRAQATVDPQVKQVLDLQSQVKKLEEALNGQKEESQKYQETQRSQAVKQISMDVKTMIESNPAYETVKDFGYDEAVTELIVQTYDEEGRLMSIDDAAKQVEEYLKAEADRIINRPSVKKRLPNASNEAQQPQGEAKAQPIQTTTGNTLSRSMAPLSSNKALRTDAERKRDAILAAQGKLTKG